MRKNTQHATRNTKLPFVFSNFAMSADGKISFADHHFTPFGSKRDHDHLFELRATADAVMSTARTVELSSATLSTGGERFRKLRLRHGLKEHHLRIIVSGSGSIDPDAEIFKGKQPSPIIILTTLRAGEERLNQLRKLAVVKICGKNEINFADAFRWLRRAWDVKRLLSEVGGELHGTLMSAGLVDELHLTLVPTIFGGRTSPTIADGPGITKIAGALQLRLTELRQHGSDIFTVFKVARRK